MNQDFNTSTRVFPIRAGEGDTLIPADFIAAIFDSASPLPPERIAPAIIVTIDMGMAASIAKKSPEKNLGAFGSHLAGAVLQDRIHEGPRH
jgi:hypothetical protein